MDYEGLKAAFAGVAKPRKETQCMDHLSLDELDDLFDTPYEQLSTNQLQPFIAEFVCAGSSDQLQHFLPAILRVWAQEIRDQNSCFAWHIPDLLITPSPEFSFGEHQFLDHHLRDPQRNAVLGYMKSELLRFIGEEKEVRVQGIGSAHAWIYEFSMFGTYARNLPELWNQWWAFPTPGHAIAAVQHASCLVFDRKDNPVFGPVPPGGGGGAPQLWGTNPSHPYWLAQNAEFFKKTITPAYLDESLGRAESVLAEWESLIRQIRQAAPQCGPRIAEVIRGLTRPEG